MKFLPLYLFLLLSMQSCTLNIAGECNNRIYQQLNNTTKTYKIIKFDRECGATVANSIQFSVLNFRDSLPDESGNIFITDSKVGSYIEKDSSTYASWLNETTILIKYDNDLNIFKKDSAVNRIRILYEMK